MKHSAKIAAALLAGTMAVSLGLTGCGEQSAGTEPSQVTSQATQQSTTKADSLTIAITNDENTLAPYTYVSGTGLVTNRLIYDTLLTIDKDNNIIPWIKNHCVVMLVRVYLPIIIQQSSSRRVPSMRRKLHSYAVFADGYRVSAPS